MDTSTLTILAPARTRGARRILIDLAVLCALLAAAAPAAAQQMKAVDQAMKQSEQSAQQASTQEKAVKASEKALSRLAAWKPGGAQTVLDAMTEAQRETAAYATAEGMLRAVRGELDQALDLLQTAVAEAGSDPAPRYYRGEVLFWKQDYDGADSAWTAAFNTAKQRVSSQGDDARAQFYKGAAAVRLKKFAAAREALNRAEELGFDRERVLFQRGLASTLEEKWADARNTFHELAESDSKFAHLYFYRGIAWSKLGHKDKMLIDMDRFIKLAPNAPEADTARSFLAAAGR